MFKIVERSRKALNEINASDLNAVTAECSRGSEREVASSILSHEKFNDG